MTQFTLFLFYKLVIITCTVTAQNQVQMADFQIFTDVNYIVSETHNFLTNITVSTLLTECAQKSLYNAMCETATFYIQTQICFHSIEKNMVWDN
jgi:uncharacterized membrane protein YciS (DUF1049 family)